MRFRVLVLTALAWHHKVVRALVSLGVFYDTDSGFESARNGGTPRHYRCWREDCLGRWAYQKPPKYVTCSHEESMESCGTKFRKCRHEPPQSYR
jgi:hypothetical protein